MTNVHDGSGLKNMSDQILKQIYGIYQTKHLTKEQIKKYKTTERDIFEKYGDLNENKLNTKCNKNFYVKNDVMITVIKRCGGEKRNERKADRFRKNLMLPESEISEYPEYKVKSKI